MVQRLVYNWRSYDARCQTLTGFFNYRYSAKPVVCYSIFYILRHWIVFFSHCVLWIGHTGTWAPHWPHRVLTWTIPDLLWRLFTIWRTDLHTVYVLCSWTGGRSYRVVLFIKTKKRLLPLFQLLRDMLLLSQNEKIFSMKMMVKSVSFNVRWVLYVLPGIIWVLWDVQITAFCSYLNFNTESQLSLNLGHISYISEHLHLH